MQYDYWIRNGTLVDFKKHCFYEGDVFIKEGRILAPPEPGSHKEAEAAKVVDAAGKYVLPGLIDGHAHWNYEGGNIGVNADLVCPSAGITTAVDAGSCGVNNFPLFYRNNIMRYITDIRAYLHISGYGVMAGGLHEEEQDPDDIDEEKIVRLFTEYPKCLKGLKVRYSTHTMGGYGSEPLKKAVRIADHINAMGYVCKVVLHSAELPGDCDIESLLNLLRPGDLYTHLYQNLGPTIFTKGGKVLPCMKKARERGVLFDTGNGGKHWTLENLKKAFKDGFYPDIISSDIVEYNKYLRPGFHLLYAMCTALLAGMDVIDVLKAVTYNPASQIGLLSEIGTLEPGTRADVAIMDIPERRVEFVDRFGGSDWSGRIFVPLMTIRSGRVVYRQIFFDGGMDNREVLRNYV